MQNLKITVALILTAVSLACSWDVNSVDNPHDIVDPGSVETPAGISAIYRTTISLFSSSFAGGSGGLSNSFVYASALAGDELISNADYATSLRMLGIGGEASSFSIDENPWSNIHLVRIHLDQAIAGAIRFRNELPDYYLVHMYAMRGYLSLFIGELYCSGVAFNRAVPGADIEFSEGLSTQQVFRKAIADFDSALAISTDSLRFLNLAKMGKARSLLNLDSYDSAASMVQSIPTLFSFQIRYGSTFNNFSNGHPGFTLADRLGGNGLDYLSAGSYLDRNNDGIDESDPRVRSIYSMTTFSNVPAKYTTTSDPVNLADGLEARLIEAEALLRNNDISGWANILNQLRRSGWSAPLDTLTSDSTVSASDTLRVNVMFRERAFWLYTTGRRFGDLRRKVRQYRRPFETVFPIGLHPTLTSVQRVFSRNANLAPPATEVESNPKYAGCFDRNA